MPLEPLVVNREECNDFELSSHLEWLETNGAGGFAMGTAAGINTRRYHGLLTAALDSPAGRWVILSRVEETVTLGGASYELGASQYPGVVAPAGFERLAEFRLEPFPVWTYQAGEATITKQLFLVEGRQTAILRYVASAAGTLAVRPFLSCRDYHTLARRSDKFQEAVSEAPGVLYLEPYAALPPVSLHHNGRTFEPDGHWYYNNEYLRERDRGLDFQEDLYSPGVLNFELKAGEPVWILVTTEASETASNRRIEELLARERWRRQVSENNPYIARLTAAANQFRVTRGGGRRTLIAGYPWFTDWGRDAMISLPGALISRNRLDEATGIISSFLAHLRQGLIPNRFPDGDQKPEYNAADATLWMFQAVWSYVQAGGEGAFVRDVFYPAAKEIIAWHQRGTLYDIQVDPSDSLLSAGSPSTQVTWMDAKVGDWVATPRNGKAVEINALWYNALRMTEQWGREFGDTDYADTLADAARAAFESFHEKFWNPERNCLYDVLTPSGPDAKLRPNQIYAVSLPFALLDPDRQRAVVEVVQAELLTPVGLRTLERGDPDYHPRYQGGPGERDAAYHCGTVWPFLMGAFLDAYRNAFGRSRETQDRCRQWIEPFEAELHNDALGTLSEIYDGDPPHRAAGCVAQLWSVAEILRVAMELER